MTHKEKLKDFFTENYEIFKGACRMYIADLYHNENFIKNRNLEDINYKLITALMMIETRLSRLEDDLNYEDKTIQ